MRKIFVIQEEVEDDRVLDALLAGGIDPDELENPRCPLCNTDTLLAYVTGGEYHVITWHYLSDEEVRMQPDAWYLICQEYACRYEEQVERVSAPDGAEIFDLLLASSVFDEESGLMSPPADLAKLITYLKQELKRTQHRKLEAFLHLARWYYDEGMDRFRAWTKRIPPRRRIEFHLRSKQIGGRFVAATEDGMLVQTEPNGEMLAVKLGAINFYGPNHFDPEESPAREEPQRAEGDGWVRMNGNSGYVVVKGYHLVLFEVDRFGQYRVGCWDPEAAAAIGLRKVAEGFWEGRLRRRDIEARYEKRRMVKVEGLWVKLSGETARTRSPHVHTEDPAVAAVLGLKQAEFRRTEDGEPRRQIPRWSGVIPRERVEAWDEVTVYQWPIPELKESGQV